MCVYMCISVTFYKLFVVEIYMTLTVDLKTDQVQMQMCQSKEHYSSCCLIVIVMFALSMLSVTIYEIFTVEMCMILTFRVGQCQM